MSRPAFFRFFNALALGVLLVATPAAQAISEAQFDSAFTTFAQARAGDASAIDQSAQAFAALLKAEPINPVLMAYAGATTAMRANTTWLPWRKMGFAEDGMALLDKSLAMLTLAFAHRFDFEWSTGTFWDGGVIELSTNGGATWADASTFGVTPGYTGTLSAASGYKLLKSGAVMFDAYGPLSLTLGFLAAAISAVLAVRWMLTWLKGHGLWIFGVYRVLLALVVAEMLGTGMLRP